MRRIEVGQKFANRIGLEFEITYVSPARYSLKAFNVVTQTTHLFLWVDKLNDYIMDGTRNVELGNQKS